MEFPRFAPNEAIGEGAGEISRTEIQALHEASRGSFDGGRQPRLPRITLTTKARLASE